MDLGGQDYDWAKVDMLINHLQRLGFSVQLDASLVCSLCTDHACGAVAALAATRLGETDWRTADLSLAVHPNIISNAVVSWLNLGLRAGYECPRPLRSDQIVDLFRSSSCMSNACPHSQSLPSRGTVVAIMVGMVLSLLCAAFRQAVETCGGRITPTM